MIERFSKLRLKNESSDKEYNLTIEEKGKGFVVNYKYGKFGKLELREGTKTTKPINLQAAVKKFDRQLTKKKNEGYTVLEGQRNPSVIKVSRVQPKIQSGFKGQWLNVITEDEALKLLEDDAWGLQEKKDGKRFLLKYDPVAQGIANFVERNNGYQGINKQGLVCAVPEPLLNKLKQAVYYGDYLVDGEWLAEDEAYWLFDILKLGNVDCTKWSYLKRHDELDIFIDKFDCAGIFCRVGLFVGSANKKKAFQKLKDIGAEGVVFKNLNAPHSSGRPNSGGDQRKFRFYDTASFIVKEVNVQRSVALELINTDGVKVSAGNVCIPPNKKIPKAGEIAEVRYLYAFKDTGCVYQPVYLGARDDVDEEECVTAQLKYKIG